MEQKEAEAVAMEMALSWYKEGRSAFILGARYEPPDNAILRLAYAEGWGDEIQGIYPSDEEVIARIFAV